MCFLRQGQYFLGAGMMVAPVVTPLYPQANLSYTQVAVRLGFIRWLSTLIFSLLPRWQIWFPPGAPYYEWFTGRVFQGPLNISLCHTLSVRLNGVYSTRSND